MTSDQIETLRRLVHDEHAYVIYAPFGRTKPVSPWAITEINGSVAYSGGQPIRLSHAEMQQFKRVIDIE